MIRPRRVVLDANILLRAVFGVRTRALIERYVETIELYTPDNCLSEASRHILRIATTKGLDSTVLELKLEQLVEANLLPVEASFYGHYEQDALARIGRRDPADWPVVATALLLHAPIWTEDRDFFGIGIPTWSTDNIEIFLRS
jgi:predicted nucleic acid-binding protein